MTAQRIRAAAAALAVVTGLAGCGAAGSGAADTAGTGSGSRVIRVMAAENFWGSIATQVGGAHVRVTSIIDNPNADPHDYEATAADGRAVATADLVLINGVGYDTWATRLAAANPAPHRTASP